MGSVTDNWYLSGELHIESEASNRPDKNAWQEHFGHPNIWGKFTKIATVRMWGLQNCYGLLQNWDTDSLFIGLKDEGSNRKDAVIAFGDDADESLRFLFAGAGFPPSPPKELLRITGSGNVGIGTLIPKAKLHVEGGAIMPAAGNGDNAGILFPSDPGGGGGDKAWIRYYPRPGGGSSERTVLEIGVDNDAAPNYQDDISLIPSGAVGIGTREPQAKLHVKGNASVLTIEGIDHGYIQFFPQSTAQRRG